MCSAGSLGSNAALIHQRPVLFCSAGPLGPNAPPGLYRERATGRRLTPSHLSCCQPWLESWWSEREGESGWNCLLLPGRKRRTKTFFHICSAVSHIPAPGSLSFPSFLQAFPSKTSSFTGNPQTTGVCQGEGDGKESPDTTFTWN